MSNYDGVYGRRNGVFKDGRYTQAKLAREMIESGFGLTEAEIDAFYARVERARAARLRPPRGSVDEMRIEIERRYSPGAKT